MLGSPRREQKSHLMASPGHCAHIDLWSYGWAETPLPNNTVWREPAGINIPKDWPSLPVKLPRSPFG